MLCANMSKKNSFKMRFHRKTTKLNPDVRFISPLLQQDDGLTTNIQKVIFDFPSKQCGSSQDSGACREKPSEGVNLAHSLLFQPESETQTSKQTGATIPPEGVKVLQAISVRPMNELLETPILEPELQTDGSTENNQTEILNDGVKIEPSVVKNEPKMIDSSSSESSSSSDEDVALCEVPNLESSVIVLEDSEDEGNTNVIKNGEQETDDESFLLEDDIVLDDSEVQRMDLSQEMDVELQSNPDLVEATRKQIFIGNIPSSMKKLHLAKFFERYGKITGLTFIRSKTNERIICFLTYKSINCARDALEANGLYYCGRNFRVSRIGRGPVIVDCTIFVSNLPPGASTQDLYNLFEICGPIKSQYLTEENEKLVAYITFELKISADYAVLTRNYILNGYKLQVLKYSNQRKQQGLHNFIM